MALGMPANWPPVEQKAAQVDKVDPVAIQTAADQFHQAASDAGDHSAALRNSTDALGGGVWQGPAADAFFNYVKQVTDAGDKVKTHLEEVGQDLSKLQQDLSEIKKNIESQRDDAKNAIEKNNQQADAAAAAADQQAAQVAKDGKGTPPNPTGDQIRQQADQQNQKTAQAADAAITSLLGQADDLIKKSQQLMQTQIDGGYSSVPLPHGGDGGTAPQSTGGIHSHGGHGGGGHHGGGGGGAGGLGPSGGPPSSGPPPGNVQQWIEEAIKDLQAAGINVTDADISNIWAIIQHESGGNPHAINLWDSNATAGHPSKGLMQCIDSTFQAHKLPGHDDIYNPVDNIIAGVRYSIDRYGSIANVPGIQSMAHGGAYRGY